MSMLFIKTFTDLSYSLRQLLSLCPKHTTSSTSTFDDHKHVLWRTITATAKRGFSHHAPARCTSASDLRAHTWRRWS